MSNRDNASNRYYSHLIKENMRKLNAPREMKFLNQNKEPTNRNDTPNHTIHELVSERTFKYSIIKEYNNKY